MTPDNVSTACALELEPGQEKFVAPVAVSLAEARRRGQSRATVLRVPGPEGPERFYPRLGFTPTGQEFHGQVVGERSL